VNKWDVKGADRDTGAERMVTVDAPDRNSAEVAASRLGLFVAEVSSHRDRLEYRAPAAASSAVPPPPAGLHRLSILTAVSILRVLAIIGYAGGLVFLILLLVVASQSAASGSLGTGLVFAVLTISPALASLAVAALLHAMAEITKAVTRV
jgi:hypothetical protein